MIFLLTKDAVILSLALLPKVCQLMEMDMSSLSSGFAKAVRDKVLFQLNYELLSTVWVWIRNPRCGLR